MTTMPNHQGRVPITPARILQYIMIALVLSIAWMVLTQQVNIEGFLLGMLLGIGVSILVLYHREVAFNPARLPLQVGMLLVYSFVLLWDIIISGIQVAQYALGFRKINPGIVKVSVQDENATVSGLSAHGITITPGQLAVDFDHLQPVRNIYVHCLDVDEADTLDAEQANRLRYLRAIVGVDATGTPPAAHSDEATNGASNHE